MKAGKDDLTLEVDLSKFRAQAAEIKRELREVLDLCDEVGRRLEALGLRAVAKSTHDGRRSGR